MLLLFVIVQFSSVKTIEKSGMLKIASNGADNFQKKTVDCDYKSKEYN